MGHSHAEVNGGGGLQTHIRIVPFSPVRHDPYRPQLAPELGPFLGYRERRIAPSSIEKRPFLGGSCRPISAFLVSAKKRRFLEWILADSLCIQKFRSCRANFQAAIRVSGSGTRGLARPKSTWGSFETCCRIHRPANNALVKDELNRRALENAGVGFIPAKSGKGVGVRLREDQEK
jgi:hypothetical protein